METIHELTNKHIIKAQIAASGQMRFDLSELQKYEQNYYTQREKKKIDIERINLIEINGTTQRILVKNGEICLKGEGGGE